jgi:hypothetical protein
VTETATSSVAVSPAASVTVSRNVSVSVTFGAVYDGVVVVAPVRVTVVPVSCVHAYV